MYWHVSAPEKVPTPGNVPTRAGADIRHTNHMDFFICKLGCAGMCQHLKKCRHLERCRHVKVPTRADIRHTNHMDFFICKLGYAGMCQHLKKCRHLGWCRHVWVPTRANIPDTKHMDFFCLDADMYWHVSAPEKVPTPGNVPTRPCADTCRHPSY